MLALFKLIHVFMQRFNRFNIINKNTMSLQPKNKNVRVLSAKIVQAQSERARPLSGVPNQTYTRRQMIVNSYNSQGADTNRVQSAKITPNIIVSQNFESDRYAKKASTKQAREKEAMASQIMGLKQTINRLVQQLSMLKGKMENMRKKNLKYSKLLTMEFEDEKQWSSNTVNAHLVSGIKNMYDTLKQKYQAKCQELDTFMRKIPITNELENQQYTQALETEVKNLKKKIEKINDVNLSSAFSSQTQRQANQYVIADLQNQKNILAQKYKELQKKYKQSAQSCKDQQLKIQIDKKLIDQKDNGIHALQRRNKQLSRQLLKIKQLNLCLAQQLSQVKSNYQKELQLHQQTIAKYQQKCRKDVQSLTQIKNAKILSLQEDNQYLHKMIQDLRSTNLQLNKDYQELKQQNVKNSSRNIGQFLGISQLKKDKSSLNKGQQKKSNQYSPPFHNGKRIPQKADKKYHQDAVKTRKIELMQVLQIAQFIRLKLIAQQFSIEQVKKLFDFRSKQGKKGEWQRQYITMAQVKQIFRESPFCLQQEDVLVISRYLIEDVQEQYVYCDDFNQNHRQVIKSIIKTLIQEYPIYKDGAPQYYQMNQEIEKYSKNLKSALKSLTKGGIISKAKLLQAMKSIGMDVQPNIFELIISKISLKSKNINELNYTTVF